MKRASFFFLICLAIPVFTQEPAYLIEIMNPPERSQKNGLQEFLTRAWVQDFFSQKNWKVQFLFSSASLTQVSLKDAQGKIIASTQAIRDHWDFLNWMEGIVGSPKKRDWLIFQKGYLKKISLQTWELYWEGMSFMASLDLKEMRALSLYDADFLFFIVPAHQIKLSFSVPTREIYLEHSSVEIWTKIASHFALF